MASVGTQKQVRAEVELAFMRVNQSQITRLVARNSPQYQEGYWETREHALLASVVASYDSKRELHVTSHGFRHLYLNGLYYRVTGELSAIR
ncbi:hypothetical protein [Cupriavidus sp. 8B]